MRTRLLLLISLFLSSHAAHAAPIDVTGLAAGISEQTISVVAVGGAVLLIVLMFTSLMWLLNVMGSGFSVLGTRFSFDRESLQWHTGSQRDYEKLEAAIAESDAYFADLEIERLIDQKIEAMRVSNEPVLPDVSPYSSYSSVTDFDRSTYDEIYGNPAEPSAVAVMEHGDFQDTLTMAEYAEKVAESERYFNDMFEDYVENRTSQNA